MPLHAYICKRCHDEFEEIQKFSDPPLKKCIKCGGKLEKQMGRSAFHLKGGGWYQDGYGSKESGSEVAKRTKEKLTKSSDSSD